MASTNPATKRTFTAGPYVRLTLIHLFVLGLVGVFMRAFPFLPEMKLLSGINFENIRHAHSHLAFLGWAFSGFFLSLSHALLPARLWTAVPFRRLFWIMQIVLGAMFICFWMWGYNGPAIVFLVLHTLLAFLFFVLLVMGAERDVRRSPVWRFVITGILFFFLSALGPVAIPVGNAMASRDPLFLQLAVNFYLHFHYNGWFVFALLALLIRWAEQSGIKFSMAQLKNQWALIALGAIPLYFLTTPYLSLPTWLRIVVLAGAIAQLAGLLWATFNWILPSFKKMRVRSTVGNLLPVFALSALLAKYIIQVIAVAASGPLALSIGDHFLIIGYLHLMFLGAVTPILLFSFLKAGWISEGILTKIGLWLMLIGILLTEIILMGKGIQLLQIPVTRPLLYSAIFILTGIILIFFQPLPRTASIQVEEI